MADYFGTAVVAGLAVASVNAYFSWRDYGSLRRAFRTFAGWLLAFVAAGLAAPLIASWLLTNVF